MGIRGSIEVARTDLPRVHVEGENINLIDSVALINSALSIVDKNRGIDESEIIGLLKIESAAHPKARPEMIKESFNYLAGEVERLDDNGYLEVVKKAIRLMKEAELFPRE